MGKFDRKQLAKTFKGLTITPAQEPGILMETTWDDKRRHRPHQLPRRGRRRQAEDRRDAPEAQALIRGGGDRGSTGAQPLVRSWGIYKGLPPCSCEGFSCGADPDTAPPLSRPSHGRSSPAHCRGPRDRRDLRAGRDRLRAALADVADHQLRPGRVRDDPGVLRARGDEVRRPAPSRWRSLVGLHRVDADPRPAVQAHRGRSDDPPRRAAAGHLHHRGRACCSRKARRSSTPPTRSPSPRCGRPPISRSAAR